MSRKSSSHYPPDEWVDAGYDLVVGGVGKVAEFVGSYLITFPALGGASLLAENHHFVPNPDVFYFADIYDDHIH